MYGVSTLNFFNQLKNMNAAPKAGCRLVLCVFVRVGFSMSTKEADEVVLKKDDAMETYLSMVVHDLRTPLAIISTCGEYLTSFSQDALTEEQKNFVNRMQRNAEKALRMVSSLLDVASSKGSYQVELEELNGASFVEKVANNVAFLGLDRKVKIRAETLADARIRIDGDKIEQAIENLVANAIKFSPAGTVVSIKTSVFNYKEESYFRIEVIDQGVGIPSDKLESIFDKFTQLDIGEAKKLGVGLGLSIAEEFVKVHGGFISVESSEGKGSSFQINLPVAIEPKPGVTGTILLVDDDEDILEFISEELKDQGFEVIAAAGVGVALKKLQSAAVDLVISDIQMPDMDGFEMLAHVRKNMEIPVILASGFYPSLSDDVAKSLFQADYFIEKPYQIESLLMVIKELLGIIDEEVVGHE